MKNSDVIYALKSKYSDLDIINKIDTLTNIYNRIWTIVFKYSFDIEHLKKLDNFSSIDICGMVHVVQDVSIKKIKIWAIYVSILNLPPNFDLTKATNFMTKEGFNKTEIVDIYHEHHHHEEIRRMKKLDTRRMVLSDAK